ncbi:hypothetical protein AaE_012182, partial [Aphanomyces astaci]
NKTLLRELSNGFVALDKLEVAESLLRRSLLTGDTSLTRKTLADVLAAQNCASTALDQYEKALEACSSMGDRAMLLARCANLLSVLGRLEDAMRQGVLYRRCETVTLAIQVALDYERSHNSTLNAARIKDFKIAATSSTTDTKEVAHHVRILHASAKMTTWK